jgi:biopolymer transport protein ExbD
MSVSLGGGNSQEVDLNLAPIIDCFTVLIAFMLVSASFLSIGLLDAGIAAATPSSSATQPPPVNIEVVVKSGFEIQIKISGKETKTLTVPANGGGLDLEKLKLSLEPIHARWPTVAGATLSAENSVEYKTIIQTMEATRKVFPAVALGGL